MKNLIPAGMMGFASGRLLRAAISLVLFQFILFVLIQALPEQHAALTERDLLTPLASRPVSGASSQPSASSSSPGPSTASSSSQPAGADPFAALRDSGSPEMQALLMEADFLEAQAAEARGGGAPAEPAPSEPGPSNAAPADSADAGPAIDLESAAPADEAPSAPAVEPESELAGAEPEAVGATADPVDSPPADEPEAAPEPIAYEAALAAIRGEDGLLAEFGQWMRAFFSGDLGDSLVSGEGSVAEILAFHLPTSLLLLLPATIIGFILGVTLGKRVAWSKQGWMDGVASVGGTAFYTSFPPWLAYVLVAVFAVRLRWFPVDKLRNPLDWVGVDVVFNRMLTQMLLTFALALGAYLIVVWLTRNSPGATTVRAISAIVITLVVIVVWGLSDRGGLALNTLHHLALPTVTLVLLSFGETMLIMRTMMAQTMEEPFVDLAQMMGYSDARVRDHHVAPVAILPVLTRFIVQLPVVIIGSFFLEYAFALDGMGERLVEAANAVDLPVVMGVLSIVAIGILFGHVLLDLVTAWLDPRRRTKAEA